MFGILQSGLSVPVAWLISGGMHCGNTFRNAEERCRELFQLPEGAIQTSEDAEAVFERLLTALPYLHDDASGVYDYLLRTSPVFKNWHAVQIQTELAAIAAE